MSQAPPVRLSRDSICNPCILEKHEPSNVNHCLIKRLDDKVPASDRPEKDPAVAAVFYDERRHVVKDIDIAILKWEKNCHTIL